MAWDKTKPTTSTKVKDSPAIFVANWEELDAFAAEEHQAMASATPGAHLPGECGVLFVGTTALIDALTPPACAVAYNTTLSAVQYYSGTDWITSVRRDLVFSSALSAIQVYSDVTSAWSTPMSSGVVYNATLSAIQYKNDATSAWGTAVVQSPEYHTVVFDIPGTVALGTNITTSFIMPFASTIISAYGYARTGPRGATLIIDVNKNGSTIWATQGNRLTFALSSNTASATTFDTTALVEQDRLDIDVDQIGSTTNYKGANVTVELKVLKTT